MGATASEWRCFGCATRSTRVPATSCRRCSGRPSTACDRAGSAPARRAGCRCPLCRTPSATRVTCTGAKCWSNVNGESTLRTAFWLHACPPQRLPAEIDGDGAVRCREAPRGGLGRRRRVQIAQALRTSLTSEPADGKTFELVAEKGEAQADLDAVR